MCIECYIDESRITPLLNPIECLQNHTQYICGTCGRCICIEHDPKRGLQRWNFPFTTVLTHHEFFTLLYLAKHPSWTLSRSAIYEAVWKELGNKCGSAVVNVVSQIRRKIGAGVYRNCSWERVSACGLRKRSREIISCSRTFL